MNLSTRVRSAEIHAAPCAAASSRVGSQVIERHGLATPIARPEGRKFHSLEREADQVEGSTAALEPGAEFLRETRLRSLAWLPDQLEPLRTQPLSPILEVEPQRLATPRRQMLPHAMTVPSRRQENSLGAGRPHGLDLDQMDHDAPARSA